ncbi:hypothetical protein ES288_A03G008000v1 [Gossypium darwinii]|uniref:RNase H type-1 domain-containing protein n=1 Tax=Gossypium darwinii TaxID=34276 RepID=A0A5D2GZR0_GOSDA|nr:hypothetical protein ES288_A03G008000v1 [Gossypium darwinii]
MNVKRSYIYDNWKGVKILDTVNVCPWCKREREKTDHLFFNCIFINGFWKRILNWWDIGWKGVSNFEDFYSFYFKLARNEMVFDNKVLTMDTLVFHAKMRPLLWSRAVFNECRFHERLWWFCPYKCCLSKSDYRGWCFSPHGWLKFNVNGIVFEGARGGGGVLRDEDGISTELGAIISALDIFIEIGWKGTVSLIIEIGSMEVFSWILEKTRKHWSHQVIFADLERRWSRVGELSFSVAKANGNEMADSLAIAGTNRTSMFKAWW